MSWSLQLRNGDLVIDGAQLGQVTGPSKLAQDLRCALLESRGQDDLHPEFGSLLDGGVDENGNQTASIIGGSNWDRIAMHVENEIRRLCREHQQKQLARTKQDRYTYGESTLNSNELLLSVTDVAMFQAQDTLVVRVYLRTGIEQEIVLDVPVTTGTQIITL